MKKFSLLEVEFGSCMEIKRALGVSISLVYLWRKTDKVPIKYLKPIEFLTGGRISPHDLRPDLLPDLNKPGIMHDRIPTNLIKKETYND